MLPHFLIGITLTVGQVRSAAMPTELPPINNPGPALLQQIGTVPPTSPPVAPPWTASDPPPATPPKQNGAANGDKDKKEANGDKDKKDKKEEKENTVDGNYGPIRTFFKQYQDAFFPKKDDKKVDERFLRTADVPRRLAGVDGLAGGMVGDRHVVLSPASCASQSAYQTHAAATVAFQPVGDGILR